jgi:hypothetical protein
MTPTPFGPVVQLAYIVDDPADAAAQWAERFGAGPFFLAEHIAVTDVVHRGVPSAFDHTSAYGWLSGPSTGMMIELFCQHDRLPSAVTEQFAEGETGLHHMAHFVDDVDEALRIGESFGWSTSMIAHAGQTVFAFIDARPTLGHYLEVYVGSPGLRGFYDMVRTAHETWDGADPVRRR